MCIDNMRFRIARLPDEFNVLKVVGRPWKTMGNQVEMFVVCKGVTLKDNVSFKCTRNK